MSFEGHIQDGVVVFDQPVSLPNGTPVRVEVAATTQTDNHDAAAPPGHFLNHYKNVIGTVSDLPPDAALNHDHYLYVCRKNERRVRRHSVLRGAAE